MKVAILVFQGVEELDFVGFLEPLAVANRIEGRRHFETELVGTEDGPIICQGGTKILPDRSLAHIGEHDLLFVPGGGAQSSTGVGLLSADKDILDRIRRSYAEGKLVWSVCTGGLVLAKAGLLDGKRATTHHSYLDEIRAAGAKIGRGRCVTDGRITTGGGISSSIDVGLTLVERELGKKVSERVRKRMEYTPSAR